MKFLRKDKGVNLLRIEWCRIKLTLLLGSAVTPRAIAPFIITLSMKPLLKSQKRIKYSLTPKERGFLLSIWEPAPTNEQRVKPFLYMVRQRLASEEEAKELLDYYLTSYQ